LGIKVSGCHLVPVISPASSAPCRCP